MDEKWTPAFLRHYIGITDIVSTVASRRTISSDREESVAGALHEYLADTTEAPRAARAVIVAIERDRVTEPASIRRELNRFVADDRVEAASIHVTALLGTDDPAGELIEWARYAEHEIRAQRAALHAPIDEAEERTLGELSSAYDELVAAQSALTARMQAAAKVKEIQDDTMRGLGIQGSFERAKLSALVVGGSVGNALGQMERLDQYSLLKGTRLAEILRNALAPSPSHADTTSSTTH